MTVICDYCGNPAELVTGKKIYPHRHDLAHKRFYRCEPCGAWVGCHDGTTTPFGRLANKSLRAWKSAAHAAFDPLWKAKMKRDRVKQHEARNAGYEWLAGQLGIEIEDCHIGMFDEKTCRQVIDVCKPHLSRSGGY